MRSQGVASSVKKFNVLPLGLASRTGRATKDSGRSDSREEDTLEFGIPVYKRLEHGVRVWQQQIRLNHAGTVGHPTELGPPILLQGIRRARGACTT